MLRSIYHIAVKNKANAQLNVNKKLNDKPLEYSLKNYQIGDMQRIKTLTYKRQITFNLILTVDENLSISEFAQRKILVEKDDTLDKHMI